jgi:EAL domain-containing protein (putative c-di-GMP-specific phosphodiesterase class I)
VVVTASMGVAHFHPGHQTAGGVLKDAEIALYEARRRGHGAVEFFRPDMHDERSELLQLERDLRRALERGEIDVVYQPIIRLADRKLAGFEALMRWRRGDIVLEPDSFVGLAEATGIIDELGRYVLHQAASRLGTWQRAFRPQEPLFVAVNISSAQLLHGDLVDDIQRLMDREDLRPGTLQLELTESLVVENPELAHKLLMRLKQMGVALACDDFGTGYSGLESVFRLPFDSVKIDRCFLEGESGDRNWIMVEAMLRLARDLNLDVVAEGIETDEQMEHLSRLGCDYGQGFLIGLPVTAQQVVEALGGLSYGAGRGTGMAAFWNRLTGGRFGEPVEQMPLGGKLDIPAFKQFLEEGHGSRADNGAAAARPAEDSDAELVIDVRSIMPVPMAPSEPAAPEVGSAPFAPRFKAPDPRRMETASREAGGAGEVRAAEPQHPPTPAIAAPAADADAAPDVAAAGDPQGDAGRPEDKRAEPDTPSKRKHRRRKLRRAAKTASPKTGPAKTASPKSASPKTGPAESASPKSGPAKSRPANGSRQGGPAKQH